MDTRLLFQSIVVSRDPELRLNNRSWNHIFAMCKISGNKKAVDISTAVSSWSGQRDSNPRPSPWQGDALPAEPCPHVWFSKFGGDARIRTGGEGFAGLCLTTWPRRHPGVLSYKELIGFPTSSLRQWSGQRDSNPRPSPWQGDALPAEPCPHLKWWALQDLNL